MSYKLRCESVNDVSLGVCVCRRWREQVWLLLCTARPLKTCRCLSSGLFFTSSCCCCWGWGACWVTSRPSSPRWETLRSSHAHSATRPSTVRFTLNDFFLQSKVISSKYTFKIFKTIELKYTIKHLSSVSEVTWCRCAAGLVCLVCLLLGLGFTTRSGSYWFTMFNDYGATLSLLFIALLEVVSVCYIYGLKRWDWALESE